MFLRSEALSKRLARDRSPICLTRAPLERGIFCTPPGLSRQLKTAADVDAKLLVGTSSSTDLTSSTEI